jgi:hypothetical protein
MSIKYMTKVWDSGRWSGSDLVMMLALADFANDNGYCWPSVPTLAQKCRTTERQAQRILHRLMDEDAPGIERARTGNGAGHSSMYCIIAEHLKKDDTSVILLDEETVTPETPLPEKRVTSRAKRVTSRVKKGDTGVTRSVIEPSIEQSLLPQADSEPTTSPPKPPPTEHQQYFAEVCAIVGWDYRVLDKNSSGQVAQTVKFLRDNGYTLAELRRFFPEIWANDWRWQKHQQFPTLTQLRQEVGKLKAVQVLTGYAPVGQPLKVEFSLAGML